MKLQFSMFKRTFVIIKSKEYFNIIVVKTPNVRTQGITSRCSDQSHVIFLDYDTPIERWIVEDELNIIQKKYNLPPFYLFASREKKSDVSKEMVGSYHAINLKKLPISKVVEIQNDTHIDNAYRKMLMGSRYRSWVLRTMPKGDRDKPTYIGIVGDMANLDAEISTAHLLALQNIYDIEKVEYTKEDGQTKIIMTEYNTAHNVDG